MIHNLIDGILIDSHKDFECLTMIQILCKVQLQLQRKICTSTKIH